VPNHRDRRRLLACISALHHLGDLSIIRVLLPDHDGVPWLWPAWGRGVAPSNHNVLLAGPERVPTVPVGAGADGSVVAHLALSPGATSAGHAGIAAVVVKAGLTARTVTVEFTVSPAASHVRVAFVTSRASASCRGSIFDTFSICAARVGVTWVVLLAALDSVRHRHIVGEALAHGVSEVVHLTPGVGAAGGWEAGVGRGCPRFNPGTPCNSVGGGGVACDASAHRVAEPVDVALRVGAAGSGVTGVRAGHTAVVLANVASAAVRVHLALTGTASDGVGLGDIGGEAPADGVPAPCHCALRVRAAGRGCARVRLLHTPVVGADEACRAVRVNLALPLAARDGVRPRDEAWQASADGVPKVVGSALGVWPTGGGITGIWLDHTLIAPADIASLTVRVPDTLPVTPRDGVRGWYEAWVALADRVACSICTEGVGSTGGRLTRVRPDNTPLTLADKVSPVSAVRVPDTLWATPCDGVRLGHQPRLTSTDGVSSQVDRAVSSWATGGGHTRVRLLHTSLAFTHKALGAVRVPDTLRPAARYGVRVGDKACLTSADSIA